MKEKLDPCGALAGSGLRNTRTRAAVLAVLAEDAAPLSAEQLYASLREKGVAANLSTVYRALETLCEKGLAAKLSIPGDPRTFFEYSRASHRHYLICLGCREIRPIERCPLAGYEKALEAETDYRISGHKLVVYGYCPACRDGGASAGKEGAP